MLLTSSWISDIVLFLVTICCLCYFYATRHFNYWKKRNVFFQKPVPFLGNFKDVFTMKRTIGSWLRESYKSAKEPYYGIWVFDQPYLVIKSPKLLINIMIKDFNYFSDRTIAYPEHDNVMKYALFFMQNPEWKQTRGQLSPSFTSGKLKLMFPAVYEIGRNFQKYLSSNLGVLEAKEVAAKYSTDVIAKCFFGINSHCFDDENAIFRVLGRNVFDFRLRNAFIATAYFSMQNLVKLFKLKFVEQWVSDYFTNSFVKAFEEREKTDTRVNDYLDILKDIKKKEVATGKFGNYGPMTAHHTTFHHGYFIPAAVHHRYTSSHSNSSRCRFITYNLDKVKGAGMQFFLAGFETTSSTISFALHELCLNKNIQNKLRQEIFTSIKENNGLTYEGLFGMKYLDMVINETLRKYPVLPFLDRKCVKDYKLPGTDLIIEKGTPVYIPLFGLHYDEKYFPDSEKFIPERFANTNPNKDGLVYMPFGEGPRNCIGERFGLLSTKIGIISVLTKFEVERCDRTPDPIEFEAKSFILQSKVGLPITFKSLVPSPA